MRPCFSHSEAAVLGNSKVAELKGFNCPLGQCSVCAPQIVRHAYRTGHFLRDHKCLDGFSGHAARRES